MTKESRPIPPLYIGIITFSLGLFLATLLQSGGLSTKHSSEVPINETDRPKSEMLFTLSDRDYKSDQLPYKQAIAWFDLQTQAAQLEIRLLEQAVIDAYVADLAAEQQRSVELVAVEVLGIEKVQEKDIADFYNENKDQLKRPLHEVKEAIEQALNQDRTRKAKSRLIAKLKEQGKLAFHRQRPKAPAADLDISGFPARGPENAKVTIVEFADFRCSHCKNAAEVIRELYEQHPNNVRWVMIDFPIRGKLSRTMAEAAQCAAKQNSYWPFHDELFKRQTSLNSESPTDIAAHLGLETESFKECLTQRETADTVKRGEKQALQLGLTGTPAIFINNIAFNDGDLETALSEAVEAALQN